MKLINTFKTIFLLITLLSTLTSTRKVKNRMKRGHSLDLYNRINSQMGICNAEGERCCSSSAFWIKEGLSQNTQEVVVNHRSSYIEKKEEIKYALNNEQIVYIAIHPDHHFIVFKEANQNYVDIYQSFQDTYSLGDWMQYYFKPSNKNKLTYTEFLEYLHDFLTIEAFPGDEDFDRSMFCMHKLFSMSSKKFINKKKNIQNWFTRNGGFERYFKHISYSSLPDLESMNFLECGFSMFNSLYTGHKELIHQKNSY